ncbi:Wd repeat-containing protein [Thalictrum thalictroides]|uniref:Wd repeat-containing protein n=1 Tax=Thalictrum thalictroides TaxID=46969 RepID=A0A7J6VQ29_THATH|nr:Wd repeat-containing protein [Thalictrum thalictroides]
MTEFLTRGDDLSALYVLQKQVSVLGIDKEKVHKLASVIVCSEDKELVKINGNGNSCIEDLRVRLVVELEELLPPPITVPKRRLEYLVETALIAQRDSCIYHNSSNRFSLYEDHCCGCDQVPTETVQILDSHENEVWFVQFSNSGEYLASSSSDCTGIIWKLWDVETGTCKHTFGEKSPIVSSCAWLPDSKRLVCGSSDPNKCIYVWDLDGNELEAWWGVRMPKVSDLAVTPDGKYVIRSCFGGVDCMFLASGSENSQVCVFY